MRLLNTSTLQLEEFIGEIPKYAILSHTWEKEEVTFSDISDHSRARSMAGFSKIEGACALAAKQEFQYIWIDTCCIDKSSSAELTEAINSMYDWYMRARVCYAYLCDVEGLEHVEKSRWFTRGWTLQELIAPRHVQFYTKDWTLLGTKRNKEFLLVLSRATDIECAVLSGHTQPMDVCVARKMYWASKRKTTRIEDEAYCLMGLFDINMPLIYGEGKRAFQRLQEAIVGQWEHDQSILAWYNRLGASFCGDILAERPACFSLSGHVTSLSPNRGRWSGSTGRQPWGSGMRLTNSRLELPAVVFRPDMIDVEGESCGVHHVTPESAVRDEKSRQWDVVVILDCQLGQHPGTSPVLTLEINDTVGPSATGYNRHIDARSPLLEFHLNEPDYLASEEMSRPLAVDPGKLNDERLGACRGHFTGEKIYINRYVRISDPMAEQRHASDSIYYVRTNFSLVLVPSRTIKHTVTVSDLAPIDKWDNKSFRLTQNVKIEGPGELPDSEVLGAVSLNVSGNEASVLGAKQVLLVFGVCKVPRDRRNESLWCHLELDEDTVDRSRPMNFSRFSDLGANYYKPFKAQACVVLGPNLCLSAGVQNAVISSQLRYLARVWLHDGSGQTIARDALAPPPSQGTEGSQKSEQVHPQ